MSPQSLSNMVWAIARSGPKNINLMQLMVLLVNYNLYRLNLQGLANIMWALQEIRYYDDCLMQNIVKRIETADDDFFKVHPAKEVAQILHCFSEFDVCSQQCLQQLITALLRGRQKDEIQECCEVILSLAILQVDVKIAQDVLNLVVQDDQFQVWEIKEDDLRQLYKAIVLYREIRGEVLQMPNELLQRCVESYDWIKVSKTKGNSLHKMVCQVSGALSGLGIEHQVYNRLFKGACDVHIAIFKHDNLKHIGIRVLNSTCYTISRPYRVIGSVQAHNDLIAACGWTLIVIPFYQWQQYVTRREQQQYLLTKLQKQNLLPNPEDRAVVTH
eukprot:TRINITY_DN15666_c0_g1_i2.p1 TRINITY_DN15666_c0_g1~~TRINITY_DN15666_c0_g1_i2.p1  ORF type:complete len:376 (-),score=21.19 TRINITY_DN15666_c0_g1_i2:307-1293(-)